MDTFFNYFNKLIESMQIDYVSVIKIIGYFLLYYATLKVINFFFEKIFYFLEKKYSFLILSKLKKSNIQRKINIILTLLILYNISLNYSGYLILIPKLLLIGFHISWVSFLNHLMNLIDKTYSQIYSKKKIPLYVQTTNIFLYILLFLIILTVLMDQSIVTILTMLGTFVTIILLIFKDTILSLVSGIQLQLDKSLEIGDWIDLPPMISGNVKEIGLYTIKIENFDKTIVSIPTIQLSNNTRKNWKGMYKSNGRRIKRPIPIDPTSIQFISKESIDRLSSNKNIQSFLDFRKMTHFSDVTNLNLYRSYIDYYLKNIRNDIWNDPRFTFLIRHLEPTSQDGIRIEIYVFTKTTNWIEYERIQSEIFEHCLTMIEAFELKLFLYTA